MLNMWLKIVVHLILSCHVAHLYLLQCVLSIGISGVSLWNIIKFFFKKDKQKHNYNSFINYYNATCFDIFVSFSGSSKSVPRQVTQVYQM